MVNVRSRLPAVRALEVLGHLHSMWAWVPCLLQIGQALTWGCFEREATALFSPCQRRSHKLRKASTRWSTGCVRRDQQAGRTD